MSSTFKSFEVSKMRLRICKKYNVVRLCFALTIIVLICNKTYTKGFKTVTIVEHVQNCPEQEYANAESPMQNIKLVKVNRTVQMLSLEWTVKRTWDEDVGFKIDLDIWGYAGWTKVPYIPLQGEFCMKFKKLFPDITSTMSSSLGTFRCPVSPGEYIMKNYTSSSSLYLPFKGRFRLRAVTTTMTTKELMFCILILLNVEEDVWG